MDQTQLREIMLKLDKVVSALEKLSARAGEIEDAVGDVQIALSKLRTTDTKPQPSE